MAEIIHPPIVPVPTAELSTERQIAEEVYTMLHDGAIQATETAQSLELVYDCTARVDMCSKVPGTSVALRLSSVPVLRVLTAEDGVNAPFIDYIAMTLEQGTYEGDIEDLPTDDDFKWVNYLLVLIDSRNYNKVELLDPNTGKEFEHTDVTIAYGAIMALRHEMRNERFEELADRDRVGANCHDTTKPKDYETPFDPEDLEDIPEFCCEEEECKRHPEAEPGIYNIPCKHNIVSQN